MFEDIIKKNAAKAALASQERQKTYYKVLSSYKIAQKNPTNAADVTPSNSQDNSVKAAPQAQPVAANNSPAKQDEKLPTAIFSLAETCVYVDFVHKTRIL